MRMREKIARALFDNWISRQSSLTRTERAWRRSRDGLLLDADAVLAAMREPTEAMVTAGTAEDDVHELAPARIHWQAMIDSAIEEDGV